MKRQSHSPIRLDEPAVMLARINFEELERKAERRRLLDLARAARPERRSLLSVLVRRWRPRWSLRWRGSRQIQPGHGEAEA